MKKYYIPIIGAISAGKSTFLKAFLGVNVLETGSTTTTKFICLIKNSNETKFYHVIPKKEKNIIFEKEGKEYKGEEDIKKKIEEINVDLTNKKGTQNDIFYMLETEIKTIENIPLLEQSFFMDIPGLNENNSTYIEDIFSLITIDDILFEIVVFDATTVEDDKIKNIFKKLERKNCLKKKKNLYILNKIDKCTKGGEGDIIDTFKKYFYETFEDEKTEHEIEINIYDNYFIPINSILYNAECRIKDDFKSAIIFELYSYLEHKDKTGIMTFCEYIKLRNEALIGQGKIDVQNELNSLNDNDNEIINNSLDEINSMTKYFVDFSLGFDFKNKRKFGNQLKELKKFFIIHKSRQYIFFHSDNYNKIQEIIKNININDNDLSSPPNIYIENKKENLINNLINKDKENKVLEKEDEKKEKKSNKIKNEIKEKFDYAIRDFEKFLKEILKIIDKNKEMKNNYSIEYLKQNMSEKKIRVAFIGNMSVGKSTVLNAIIGKSILPTSLKECTYRGVILKHNNCNNYKLYKTRLIKKGKDIDEYYIFKPDANPACEGDEQIKSYLKNKNNDKKIEDRDAYIIITGKLRIFDFIKLNQELINRIEFIDLPGHNRENNEFNKKKYYKKILRFTNCCVYINESKSIEDEDSFNRIKSQYEEDKQKVLSVFRNRFIKTCLFLINKSDEITEEKDRNKIKNILLKNICSLEKDAKNEDINISFFSGKCFNYYLEMYCKYVIDLENSPKNILQEIVSEWYKKYFHKWKFYDYIDNHFFRDVEKKLDLDLFEEIDKSKEFEKFHQKLKKNLEELCKINNLDLNNEEEDEIIAQFYLLNKYLKEKDFQNTNYSYLFFEKLKTVIINSSNMQKENFEQAIISYFDNLDFLFCQKYDKNKEKIEEKKKEIESLETNIEIAKDLFDKSESDIKKCFDEGVGQCLKIINENIENADKILANANNNIKDAADNMQQKINNKVENIKTKQMELIIKLTKKLGNILEDKMSKIEKKINSLSIKEIDTVSENNGNIIGSFFKSTISGVAVRTGLSYIGQAIVSTELITSGAAVTGAAAATGAATGAAAATGTAVATGTATATELIGASLVGPLGIALGIGVGISILCYQLYQAYNKTSQYKNALKEYKDKFIKKMNESKEICLEDFNLYRNELFKDISQKIELYKHDISMTEIKEEDWQKLKDEYNVKKNNIIELMKNNILD